MIWTALLTALAYVISPCHRARTCHWPIILSTSGVSKNAPLASVVARNVRTSLQPRHCPQTLPAVRAALGAAYQEFREPPL